MNTISNFEFYFIFLIMFLFLENVEILFSTLIFSVNTLLIFIFFRFVYKSVRSETSQNLFTYSI